MTAWTDKFTAFRSGSAAQAFFRIVFVVLLSASFVYMSVVFFFLSAPFIHLSGGVVILSGSMSYFCPDPAWVLQDQDKYMITLDGSMKEKDNCKNDQDKNTPFCFLQTYNTYICPAVLSCVAPVYVALERTRPSPAIACYSATIPHNTLLSGRF